MINVGIVGFGLAGKVFHAPFVRAVSGLKLVAVARRDRQPDPAYPEVRFAAGILYDLASHLADQALLLFGKPQFVSADLRKERDGTLVNDACDVVFHYSRMRAQLRATSMAAAPGPRFWICGAEGTFTKYGLDPQEDAMKQGGDPNAKTWGEESQSHWGELTTADSTKVVPTIAGDYRGYYENVRDAILGRAALEVTPEQALDVMRALELAERSSSAGCKLPWATS